MGGWMDGWVGGWIDVWARLRIAYSNQQHTTEYFKMHPTVAKTYKIYLQKITQLFVCFDFRRGSSLYVRGIYHPSIVKKLTANYNMDGPLLRFSKDFMWNNNWIESIVMNIRMHWDGVDPPGHWLVACKFYHLFWHDISSQFLKR